MLNNLLSNTSTFGHLLFVKTIIKIAKKADDIDFSISTAFLLRQLQPNTSSQSIQCLLILIQK